MIGFVMLMERNIIACERTTTCIVVEVPKTRNSFLIDGLIPHF